MTKKTLLDEKSLSGGRIFLIIQEPLFFDYYEEELREINTISELSITKNGDSSTEVSLLFMGQHIEIEVVCPYGTYLHPNARTIFVVKETECPNSVLTAFISELENKDIF